MADLPTGTVTFLYTDIEGSTVRWEQQPVQMKAAVERHDTIVRQAVTDNGGSVFRVMGDAFCAVFPLAAQAVSATLQAQRALQSPKSQVPSPKSREKGEGTRDFGLWTLDFGEPLKVRMAVHTGVGEVRDGDYVGQPLNRIARLLSTGYGGQTLLSQPAADLLGDDLPAGVTLEDLGEHLLKDLARPEHIYQLAAPDLATDFPPLKTLDAMPNNLPVQLTSFIGREKEMEEVKRLLSNTRLLTLIGPGGTGKTRLSIQVAADMLDSYPDGVWLVELAPISNPDLILQAIASGLGVREGINRPMLSVLTDYLRAKNALLILDNCEHMIEACAQLVDNLLHTCPNLHIFASSREALGIGGETSYRVPSLSLPDTRHLPPVNILTQYEAVRLFIDRAVAAQSDFSVTSQSAPAVAQICHRLDGIPLAIELAAARVKVLTVEQIAERLDDRFRLLTGGSRTALPRQQTLKALIDWSYDLLPDTEKTLLRRLSVFSEGCTLEAVETVCAGEGIEEYELLDLLAKLVDKSLVVFEKRDSPGRYRLLETIRQYSQDKLVEAGEGEQTRNKHLSFFLELVEKAAPKLIGPEQIDWFSRLDAEQDNLRAALGWSQSGPHIDEVNAMTASRMASSLWFYWFQRGQISEGLNWIEGALALPGPDVKQDKQYAGLRSKMLFGAVELAWAVPMYYKALAFNEENTSIGKQLQDKQILAGALLWQGTLERFNRSPQESHSIFEEAVSLYLQTNDKWGLATAVQALGIMGVGQDEYALAERSLQESLRIYREIGDKWGASQSLNFLGDVYRIKGDYAQAEPLYEESLSLYRELGTRRDIPASIHNLGYTALGRGDFDLAKARFNESMALQLELGNQPGIGECLSGFAAIALAQKQAERAARLYGAVDALLEALDALMWPAEQIEYNRNVEKIHSQINEEMFNKAWAEGRAMSLEQAMTYAQED